MDQLSHTQLPDCLPTLTSLPDVHENKQEVQSALAQAKQSLNPRSQSDDDHIDVHQTDILAEFHRPITPLIRPIPALPDLVVDPDQLYQVRL